MAIVVIVAILTVIISVGRRFILPLCRTSICCVRLSVALVMGFNDGGCSQIAHPVVEDCIQRVAVSN